MYALAIDRASQRALMEKGWRREKCRVAPFVRLFEGSGRNIPSLARILSV